MTRCKLYRCLWVTEIGYVVYRHDFAGRIPALAAIRAGNKCAVFVCGDEANDYCIYRNRLIGKRGTDALPVRRATRRP